jgi:uronate dehydrogenase
MWKLFTDAFLAGTVWTAAHICQGCERSGYVSEHLLVTGAAGAVGSLLRPLLRRPGRRLTLLDLATPPDLDPATERHAAASVTDPRAMDAAMDGVDLVVHLGGIAKERPWRQVLETNIHGTQVVLDAAQRAGVPRALLASSVHVVGMVPATAAGGRLDPRPDTFYAVSKVAVEALGSLYADRYGMTVVSARIGTVHRVPGDVRCLSTWLSPADLARLVEAVLVLPGPGHHVINAVSRNTRGWLGLDAGAAIGYHPLDDAEDWAGDFPEAGPPGPPSAGDLLGGFWADPDLAPGTPL